MPNADTRPDDDFDFRITKKLLDSCTNRDYTYKTIIFETHLKNPIDLGGEQDQADFLYSTEKNDVLEIMIFKSTVKQIIAECHPFLRKFLSGKTNVSELNERELLEVYYMTVGMMFITHEHNTVLNIHKSIVELILESNFTIFKDLLFDSKTFIFKELNLIQSLLNSNNNHINKSSSLWHLLKVLYIHVVDAEYEIPERIRITDFIINTVITAGEIHFTNYYAWNFLRFIINVSKLQKHCKYHLKIHDLIKKFCRAHHSDSAAWDCYFNSYTLNIKSLELTCWEFNKVSKRIKLSVLRKQLTLLFPSTNSDLLELSKWLWENKVIAKPPYITFQNFAIYNVKQWKEHTLVREMFGQIHIHTSLVEELKFKPKRIKVNIHKGYHTVENVDLSQDYELDEFIQNYVNWKQLDIWYDTFVKNKLIRHDSLDD